MEMGYVYDVNFYGKSYVPDVNKKQENKNWREWEIQDPTEKSIDAENEQIASLLHVRIDLRHNESRWKNYKKNSEKIWGFVLNKENISSVKQKDRWSI